MGLFQLKASTARETPSGLKAEIEFCFDESSFIFFVGFKPPGCQTRRLSMLCSRSKPSKCRACLAGMSKPPYPLACFDEFSHDPWIGDVPPKLSGLSSARIYIDNRQPISQSQVNSLENAECSLWQNVGKCYPRR